MLTRKRGERIRIGDGWLTVVDVDKGTVRLGFEFPPDVEIERDDARKGREDRGREGRP